MGRNTALSVVVLVMVGGTGFALPDWINIYDFYGAPSSGALGATADADIHNVSGTFSTMPKGGFGPPATAFKIQSRVYSVVQPHPALRFNDRWLFDYASGSHHPHQHHRRRWARSPELWSFLEARDCYRCSANVWGQA